MFRQENKIFQFLKFNIVHKMIQDLLHQEFLLLLILDLLQLILLIMMMQLILLLKTCLFKFQYRQGEDLQNLIYLAYFNLLLVGLEIKYKYHLSELILAEKHNLNSFVKKIKMMKNNNLYKLLKLEHFLFIHHNFFYIKEKV